jgi:hypothetical protein
VGKLTDFITGKKSGEDGTPDSGGSETPDNLASVRSELRKNRVRGGKLEREAASAELQRELDKLYTPENWKAIGSMYFDARYVTTGDDLFRLTESEQTTLGTSLAASARLLLKIDPGYIALIIFMSNMGKMIAVKEVQYSQKKKRSVHPGPVAVKSA